MFSGKIFRSSAGLFVDDNHLIYPGMLYSLEGKAWDAEKRTMRAILPYAKVVYVNLDGDMWYYADQNNYCMPIVRDADRMRVWDVMNQLGIHVARTNRNREY